ncbi:MAG: hypothetical protein ABI548_03935 [Polyangiaceae bacterium]
MRRRLAAELLPEQHRLNEQLEDRLDPARVVTRDAPRIAALRDALHRAVKAKSIDDDGLEAVCLIEREIESMPPSLATALWQVREAGCRLTNPAVVATAGEHLAAALEDYWSAATRALARN